MFYVARLPDVVTIPGLPSRTEVARSSVQSGESSGVAAIGLNPWSDQLRYLDVMLNHLVNIERNNQLDVKPNLLERLDAHLCRSQPPYELSRN